MRPQSSAAYATREVRQGVNGFLWRQAEALFGVLLMAGVLAAIAALGTWSVADPSFSHATGNIPVNALGHAGAIFADLSMQFLGLASVPVLVPVLLAGFRLARGRGISNRSRRMLALIGGAICMSAVFAAFNPPATWPLPVGVGGVIGDLLLKIPGAFSSTGYPQGLFAVLSGVVLAGPALWLLAYAGALTGSAAPAANPQAKRKQTVTEEEDDLFEDEEEGRFLALGALAHYWYALRGFVARLAGSFASRRGSEADEMFAPAAKQARRSAAADELNDDEDRNLDDMVRAPRRRQEPAFALGGQVSQPDVSDDDDFDDMMIDAPSPRMGGRAAPVNGLRIETEVARPKPGSRVSREAQQTLLAADGYEKPSLHLLAEPKNVVKDASLSKDALEQNARNLEGVLDDFGVRGEIIQVRPGPVVTLYELEPAPGIKSSRVIGLADDIARSMSAIAARVAVVPGRNAIGIELPNQRRETVYLREMLASQDFEASKAKLGLALGKTINGEPVIADLAKMPHVLVAGTTGSGKSVSINTMILSLLYRMTPAECRLIMIDPKMLELSVYDGIPHLLTPVVTDPKKAVVALKWTVKEMEDRYRKMSKVGVRNIDGFNQRVKQAQETGEQATRTVQTGFDRHTGEAIYETENIELKHMPYIVVLIDEMADLMMVAGKDIEGAVQRLAQMARAAGIHVIMATQRPSVDVITGTIKANFPTRISFQVTSKIDSRTILGEMGAEQLLGQGDMLYMAGGGRIQRVHGPFVSDDEVEKVVAHLKLQGAPEYLESITADDDEDDEDGGGPLGTSNLSDSDDPYDQAVAIVLRDKKASTSYIQRRMGIGYNRAASLIERMEQEGIVGPANQTGKRDILVPTEDDMM
ncbi:MAG: DNA translocase FtsK [Rhizobiaceae bacterium]